METIEDNAIALRVRYEAFSQFATELNEVTDLNAISSVIANHLKYLIDLFITRITFFYPEDTIQYLLSKGNCTLFRFTPSSDITIETYLLEHEIPKVYYREAILAHSLLKDNVFDHPKVNYVLGLPRNLKTKYGWVCVLGGKNLVNSHKTDFKFMRLIGELLNTKVTHLLVESALEKNVIELQESNTKIQEAKKELEHQNTALTTTNRKLEDLNYTKEHLLEKIWKLYKTDLDELQSILENPHNESAIVSKKTLHQAERKVHQIKEILRPITSLYFSEQAIQSKRVLLAEPHKKQQITAKMALGGTGVELDIVSNFEEGQKLLEEKNYDLICTNKELIKLVQLAHEQTPDIQSVFMTREDISTYLPLLREYPYLSNIVSHDEEDRIFTLKNILTTVSKLMSNDLFGLEKYLNWGVDVHQKSIVGSKDRAQLIDEMETYFKRLGVRRNALSKGIGVAEELLMNAIYDAPVNEDGEPLYNHLSRTVPVELKPEEQGEFRYACDGMLLAISTQDPFGSLERNTILDYLERCYQGRTESPHLEKGGAGLGLFEVMEATDLLVINVKPGIKTEVIALFNLTLKPNCQKTTSFHYFFG